MFTSKKLRNLFLGIGLLAGVGLFAQNQEVSDTELTQFANAYVQVQQQNQEAQMAMVKLIENEGLEVERFSMIQQASMDPSQPVDATEEEIQKHDAVIEKIEELQPDFEKRAIESIESTGISFERFQTLAAAIQQDQSLQERLQNILMESQLSE